MADSKITDFTAATSVNSADVLYLVQGSSDRKISISTLLANLPATLSKFTGTVVLGGSIQTIANAGMINATTTTTYITNTINSELTISNGLYEGQLKIVICSAATATSTITIGVGATSIEFSEPGHTALLMYSTTQGKWYFIGGTATVNF